MISRYCSFSALRCSTGVELDSSVLFLEVLYFLRPLAYSKMLAFSFFPFLRASLVVRRSNLLEEKARFADGLLCPSWESARNRP
jgi:hypothetical protein